MNALTYFIFQAEIFLCFLFLIFKGNLNGCLFAIALFTKMWTLTLRPLLISNHRVINDL